MKILSLFLAVLIVFSGFYVLADVIVQDTLKDGVHRIQLTEAQYKVYLSRGLYKQYALKHEFIKSTAAAVSGSRVSTVSASRKLYSLK